MPGGRSRGGFEMSRGLRYGGGLVLLLAVGVLGWGYLRGDHAVRAANQPAPPPEVPVTTTVVKRQDVPVLLEGLGNVQAFNAVAIRAQVNGVLVALPAKEGQEVHTGDIVAEIDPRPYQAALDQAKAQLAGDQAQLESAQLDLQRYQSLAAKQFAPVQQVQDQTGSVNKLRASLQADQAAVETAQINLGYCVIRSPIDGRVSLYQVDLGNLIEVSGASTIVTIMQDKPIAVIYTLPQGELDQVRAAMKRGPVSVGVSSNDDQVALATATLMTPNNQIDAATGTITLRASYPNDDDKLWPGEFVNTRTQVDVLKGVLTLPTNAVEHGPNGLFVYRIKPDNTAESVPVQVSYDQGGVSVIAKGLDENDSVVLDGQSRLAQGTHVKAQQAQTPTARSVGTPDHAQPS